MNPESAGFGECSGGRGQRVVINRRDRNSTAARPAQIVSPILFIAFVLDRSFGQGWTN